MQTLTPEDFSAAAQQLRCTVAVMRAVAAVESRGAGFDAQGRPVILFERHIFWRETKGAHGLNALSNPSPGGYTKAREHERLGRAIALDEEAALRSTSWGMFQLMGFNHAACGFGSVQAFVAAMHHSERAQLLAFVAFVIHAGLDGHLRRQQWALFAAGYNGKAYAKNHYDTKLAREHLRAIQHGLSQLGFRPGPIDGAFGPTTSRAVSEFQAARHLPVTGILTDSTLDALSAEMK
jgi:hypothetical protein